LINSSARSWEKSRTCCVPEGGKVSVKVHNCMVSVSGEAFSPGGGVAKRTWALGGGL